MDDNLTLTHTKNIFSSMKVLLVAVVFGLRNKARAGQLQEKSRLSHSLFFIHVPSLSLVFIHLGRAIHSVLCRCGTDDDA